MSQITNSLVVVAFSVVAIVCVAHGENLEAVLWILTAQAARIAGALEAGR